MDDSQDVIDSEVSFQFLDEVVDRHGEPVALFSHLRVEDPSRCVTDKICGLEDFQGFFLFHWLVSQS